jgi:hypothetical protein
MVKLLWLRVATYRQFPLPVRFIDYENRELLENGDSWMRNVYRTPIANQVWAIEWSGYFRYAAPPSGSFRFRSVQKSWITRERWQLDEKCLQNTISKPGSVCRIFKILLLRVATQRRFPLPVRFNDYENRELLENGGSWTKNVYRTPIAKPGSVYRMVKLLLLRVAT